MATEETPVSQESKFQEMLFNMMARRWNITGIVLVTFMLIVAGITGAVYMQTPIDGEWKELLLLRIYNLLISFLMYLIMMNHLLRPSFVLTSCPYRYPRTNNQ